MLLGDLGIPLALDSADVGDPVQMGVVDLANLLHALHELREGLELGPLVVGRADRDVDLDGLLNGGHACGLPATPPDQSESGSHENASKSTETRPARRTMAVMTVTDEQMNTKAPGEEIRWLSTAAAAKRLGITNRTLYRFIDEGLLPAYRFGRVIRLQQKEVDTFIQRSRIEPGTLEHLYPESTSATSDTA